MVTLARSSPGVYGARMTGGGFGGCAIALAQANHVAAIVERVRDGYTGLTGVTPDVFATSAHAGAAVRTPQAPESK
jgi:galactokinase